jgi:hypothetical protein
LGRADKMVDRPSLRRTAMTAERTHAVLAQVASFGVGAVDLPIAYALDGRKDGLISRQSGWMSSGTGVETSSMPDRRVFERGLVLPCTFGDIHARGGDENDVPLCP